MRHLREALQNFPRVLHEQLFCFFLKRDRNTSKSSYKYPAGKLYPGVVYSLLIGPITMSLTALTSSLAHAPNRETLPLIFVALYSISTERKALPPYLWFEANWFEAVTRLWSDKGLVQMTDIRRRYSLAAHSKTSLCSCITLSSTPRNLYCFPSSRLGILAVSSNIIPELPLTCTPLHCTLLGIPR